MPELLYPVLIMNTEHKTKTKDFFLHLGMMVSLYAGTIALLNLLFKIINVAYPRIEKYGYWLSANPGVSFPVATLIVVFPLFLFLANIINKEYRKDPSKKDFAPRNWLIYITLFITGVLVVGDLVTLVYFFLDGKELTTGFLLKALSIAVVGGSVFGYFLDDLRNKLTVSRRNIWRITSLVLVIGSIVMGFVIIGSPRDQRLIRYDGQKIMDLQNIQGQIVAYWQAKGSLPETLDLLLDPLSYYGGMPTDPQSGESYEYEKTGDMRFTLCAIFNTDSVKMSPQSPLSSPFGLRVSSHEGDNWQYEKGGFCFEREIDPDRYPPFKNLKVSDF